MTKPTPSRNKAMGALRGLSGNRPTRDQTLGEIFPFGLMTYRIADPSRQRAAVLMSATAIEQALEVAILSKCDPEMEVKLFSGDSAIIQSLNAKIVLARALRLIGPRAYDDLVVIRNIRNVFAHSRVAIDFSNPQIIDACDHISLPERVPPERDFHKPIDRFVYSSLDYFAALMTCEAGAKGRKSLFVKQVLDL